MNATVTNDNEYYSDASSLITEEQNDASLADCHALAKAGKGNLIYRDGVLYPGNRIFGQRIWQLVVPNGRREHVLKLTHVRATRQFEMIVIDVIGPIEPPAGPQKFAYVLWIVDSFTRFASAGC